MDLTRGAISPVTAMTTPAIALTNPASAPLALSAIWQKGTTTAMIAPTAKNPNPTENSDCLAARVTQNERGSSTCRPLDSRAHSHRAAATIKTAPNVTLGIDGEKPHSDTGD